MVSGKRIFITIAVLIGIAAWRGFHPAGSFAADGDSSWNAAVAESQSTGKPGLVLFTANWCPACRALHTQVLSQREVGDAIDSRYTWVVVDLTHPTESQQARAQKYGVNAIPTLIRFDKDGHETARTNGMNADALIKWLED